MTADLYPLVVKSLIDYCRSRDWAGHDPYDALNSKVVQFCGLDRSRLAGFAITQIVKRSPINLRPLLLVPPGHNPKGIALFISALLKLQHSGFDSFEPELHNLITRLKALRSPDTDFWCWGYHFPWQSRSALFPRWIPNIICTTFAGNALLDAYEATRNQEFLEIANSSADFILEKLYRETEDGLACISYMPLNPSRVHNANLLGAAFLCRVARLARRDALLEPALKAAKYSVARQYADGSWDYGDSDNPPQRWRDNFHTGFNLCALRTIIDHSGSRDFEPSLRQGFDYFRRNFFVSDGVPKYFHNRTYPIDIHSSAQSIITLVSCGGGDLESVRLADSVCQWTLRHMRARAGYFHFQIHPLYTNRIPYMRWSQAWMLLALSILLEQTQADR
jgi:hypothetical protein